MKIFVSWSGGKDSALAAYRAQRQGHQVVCLLNVIAEDGIRTRSHGLPAQVIELQAQAMGVPLIQVKTSWEEYEVRFKDAVQALIGKGVTGGVFGDMALDEHREWVERVCAEVWIHPLLPLWGEDPYALLEEFWALGFRTLVVASRLGPESPGRWLDRKLVTEMVARGAHPCGEEGEYHTLVIDGPLFRHPLPIRWNHQTESAISLHQDVWFLNVKATLESRDG